jgi:hypothetical protein
VIVWFYTPYILRSGAVLKLIRFFTGKDFHELGKPSPIKNFIPEWYRKAETEYSIPNGETAPGLKKCIPYLDTMMSGYAILTPIDIFVGKNEDGSLKIEWNGPPSLGGFIGERPKELGATMPRPAGHHPNHLVWKGHWGIKTPRGWSLLMTHPLNRFDLPFTTTSGIIDSDKFSASGNIPFFIKEDFIGVIPAGTPIAQLIPIKRASWKGVSDAGLRDLEQIQGTLVRKADRWSYKKLLWIRKEYN